MWLIRCSIFALLMLVINSSYANTQYSREHCQRLNQQRKDIQKKLRQPYTAKQGEKLQAEEKALLRILRAHCKKPS
ncbi:hypothetical protein [Rheinheimera sp. MMS21-TC3]|uniref:hypothetical protein n=1 Tax=Rheinheimera sp. MMS21-TC3 TaxID=3072790 RepID=UPI0028C4AA95|nr:hypothetical protein [Rheinheimera sp. MMS21-TC3]WNO61599.1 hypothetical protein RDV63_11775 [Rheinheimera sp. MMS21-TC3]